MPASSRGERQSGCTSCRSVLLASSTTSATQAARVRRACQRAKHRRAASSYYGARADRRGRHERPLSKARDITRVLVEPDAGRDCISVVPADRWTGAPSTAIRQKEEKQDDVKWGGFIDGVADFDPFFFGLSPP